MVSLCGLEDLGFRLEGLGFSVQGLRRGRIQASRQKSKRSQR